MRDGKFEVGDIVALTEEEKDDILRAQGFLHLPKHLEISKVLKRHLIATEIPGKDSWLLRNSDIEFIDSASEKKESTETRMIEYHDTAKAKSRVKNIFTKFARLWSFMSAYLSGAIK